jgi:glycosyltransferase involved in cell wall biosynthesis
MAEGTLAMKRIAIYLPSLIGGGAERVMVNIARGFAERDFKVDLVLAKKEGPCLAHVPESVRIVDLGGVRVLRSVPALASYLRRERPPVLLSALDHSNLAALWARSLCGASTRMILTLHNTIPPASSPKVRIFNEFIFRAQRAALRPGDQVVAVSSGVAESYVEHTALRDVPIEVIYNPVVSDELYKKAEEPLKEWIAPEGPYFIGIGRLHEQKDFPNLIAAFERVRRQRQAKLVILGEGDLRTELEAMSAKLGLAEDVLMPGFISNPYPVLKGAKAFVLSSRREGLPTVLIEALALGVPVISTNCRSGPEEILMGGRFGKLVPVGDPEALADAMIKILDDEKQTAGREAIRRFEQDWAVSEYIQLVQRGNC